MELTHSSLRPLHSPQFFAPRFRDFYSTQFGQEWRKEWDAKHTLFINWVLNSENLTPDGLASRGDGGC